MSRNSIYILLTVVFASCANTDRKVVLKSGEDTDEIIQYEGSKKHGYFINAVRSINGVKVHYNLHLTDDGRILNILKRNQKYYENEEETLDSYRSLELLVTDTSKNNPNFFGNPINGYYSADVFNNVISDSNNSKTKLTSILQEERTLFFLIDSVTKVNDVRYIQFDTSKVLGWFKYVF